MWMEPSAVESLSRLGETGVMLGIASTPVGGKGGRPPSRDLTEAEYRRLRRLYESYQQADDARMDRQAALRDYVLELTEAGLSSSRIAKVLGVVPQTIQNWVSSARRHRQQK